VFIFVWYIIQFDYCQVTKFVVNATETKPF